MLYMNYDHQSGCESMMWRYTLILKIYFFCPHQRGLSGNNQHRMVLKTIKVVILPCNFTAYKMARLFLFISVVFYYSHLAGQDTYALTGKIVDEEGQPLSGALVYISPEEVSYSDNSGQFRLSTTADTLSLFIQYLGYEDTTLELDMQGGNLSVGTILMTERSTLMKEVQISGSVLPYKTSHKGSNYYVSPVQLKKTQPVSTEEVLKTLPGVQVLGDMGLANRINVSIRGSWGRRSEKVLMLEDGSPISPAPYVAPGIYYNTISDRVEGMEVMTGSDILKFGPNNMYGIINYITPRPPQESRLRMKITGGQRGFFTGLLSYGGTWKKVGSHIEAVYKKFDGFTQNSSVEMINLNAKFFAELSEEQSLYFKVSGQFEDNQASWSAITPFTFQADPIQHPFDADRFIMHRYGLDIIHKWVPEQSSYKLTTKIFASDFARDWWRQNNAVIRASDVRNYVGEDIFSQKYLYIDNFNPDMDAFVRVGAIRNSRESTTNSAWHFTVASLEETYTYDWNTGNIQHQTEVQARLHTETYQDRFIVADSSRWARSGRFTRDQGYRVNSLSGYIRHQMTLSRWVMTPIMRVESISMTQDNRLLKSVDPQLTSDSDLLRTNAYSVLQPGLSAVYRKKQSEIFASVYRGFIAPSKYFAFLVEREGVLVNPLTPEELSNVRPETSINSELGIRGEFLKNILDGQLAFFNNRVRNFYLAGWNEFFEQLGVINIQGLETALHVQILPQTMTHQLIFKANLTLLRSRVMSGRLVDRHLFSLVKHNDKTRKEFVDKVNQLPQGYTVYTTDNQGQEVVLSAPISAEDLDRITRTEFHFGKEGIRNGVSPYSPELSYTLTVSYQFKKVQADITFNYVGDQYAEFANFDNESGDGGIGKISAFQTWDINLMYEGQISDNIKGSFFLSGKNLGNDLFVASRLNRGQSGIMPGGFRQINAGVLFDF